MRILTLSIVAFLAASFTWAQAPSPDGPPAQGPPPAGKTPPVKSSSDAWFSFTTRGGAVVAPAQGRPSSEAAGDRVDPFATTQTMRDEAARRSGGVASAGTSGPIVPMFIPRMRLKGTSVGADGSGVAMLELSDDDHVVVRVDDEVSVSDQGRSVVVRVVRISGGSVVLQVGPAMEVVVR